MVAEAVSRGIVRCDFADKGGGDAELAEDKARDSG